jgi:aryl-alcohol dehydrogenase-like predicted oxidoreductase
MDQRDLGMTGLRVSALGFGCGAIGGLFVKGTADEQHRAFDEAVAGGITYFDTAPGYGDGASETNLGRVLDETGSPVVVGTKVRLAPGELTDAAGAIRRSLEASLRRLRRERVDLIQLHNRVGARRDDASGQLSVEDVLGPVLDGLREVQIAGLANHLGFTGLGETDAVARVLASGGFATMQSYFNVLNPSAGWAGRAPSGSQDFDGLIDRAAAADVGVIVIRPLAAGAVGGEPGRHPNAGNPGSALVAGGDYAADLQRALVLVHLASELGLDGPIELALRFALAKPGVSTALVGFSDLAQLRDALRWAERGPLSPAAIQRVLETIA